MEPPKIKVLGIAPYEAMKNVMEKLARKRPQMEMDVYVGDLKTVQVYTASPQTVQKLLEKYEIPEEPVCLKLWDILSDENPCELIHVEVEEENIFDLPELLSEAGIYFSGRRED